MPPMTDTHPSVERARLGFLERDLPEYMWEGVKLWLERGICTGSFLRAVLQNDLKGSSGAADVNNRAMIFEWACFMRSSMPYYTQGSPDVCQAWCDKGGLEGKEEDNGPTHPHNPT